MHQIRHHVIHRKFFHRHHLHGRSQIFERLRQFLEQCYDNVFVSHGYLQTNELIHERLNFVDVVQQVVDLLQLAYEKFATNEEDVGETLRLVNVVESLSRLRGSFTTLNVYKLIVY